MVILQQSVVQNLEDAELFEIHLYTKWGLDGSSGHSSSQGFHGQNESDSSVFVTSIVPLKLETKNKVI